MIRYDKTQRSVLAICACGWRSLAGDQLEAEHIAMLHVHRAHAADELREARQKAIHASHQRASSRRDTPRG